MVQYWGSDISGSVITTIAIIATAASRSRGSSTDAAALLGIDLSRSVLVGDRWRDISAGKAAGCRTVWIDGGYRERQPEDYDFRAASMLDASEWILAREKSNEREQP